VNTSGYGGRRLQKKIRVQTDDTKHPFVSFAIMGDVEEFVHLEPKKVYLRGVAGTDIKKTVSIIPVEKYPFKILEARATNGRDISYKLEKDKNSEIKGYLLTIENRKKEKGPYFDTINLKTDSKIQPIIKVRVYGNILNPRKQDVE
jgi:hypothetical protein